MFSSSFGRSIPSDCALFDADWGYLVRGSMSSLLRMAAHTALLHVSQRGLQVECGTFGKMHRSDTPRGIYVPSQRASVGHPEVSHSLNSEVSSGGAAERTNVKSLPAVGRLHRCELGITWNPRRRAGPKKLRAQSPFYVEGGLELPEAGFGRVSKRQGLLAE